MATAEKQYFRYRISVEVDDKSRWACKVETFHTDKGVDGPGSDCWTPRFDTPWQAIQAAAALIMKDRGTMLGTMLGLPMNTNPELDKEPTPKYRRL